MVPVVPLIGCGQILNVTDAASDGAVEIRDASVDTNVDVADTAVPEDRWTPCGVRPAKGLFDCCDGGIACRGYCDPVVGCTCNGIVGGCKNSVCCGINNPNCTSETECVSGH